MGQSRVYRSRAILENGNNAAQVRGPGFYVFGWLLTRPQPWAPPMSNFQKLWSAKNQIFAQNLCSTIAPTLPSGS